MSEQRTIKKQVIAKNLWAAVVTPRRGHRWVDPSSIRYTRYAAKAAYLNDVSEIYHAEMLERVRFERVTVTTLPT